MKVNRRNLLWASAGLAITKLVGPTPSQALVGSDKFLWRPFTRSLLDRARRANLMDGRTNTALVERLIHQEFVTQRDTNPSVMPDPFDAFDYLSQFGCTSCPK